MNTIVTIQGEEYQKILKLSDQNGKNFKKRKGKYGQGAKNTKKDPNQVEREGALGELAFAILMGWSYTYKEYSRTYDFVSPSGTKIDVKTTTQRYDVPIKVDKVHRSKADVYSMMKLLKDDGKEKAVLEYIGSISRKGVMEKYTPEKSRARDCEWYNYFIPFGDLKK